MIEQDVSDAIMLAFWEKGFDTLTIAQSMFVPESVVYARLPLLRRLSLKNHAPQKS